MEHPMQASVKKLTSSNGKSKNSSVPTTCWKFCSAYLCERVWSSLQECASVVIVVVINKQRLPSINRQKIFPLTSKTAYAQAVGWMQLSQQEFAARLTYRMNLQQTGGGQQDLHIVFSYRDLTGVGVIDELTQSRHINIVQTNRTLIALQHIIWVGEVKWSVVVRKLKFEDSYLL